MTKSEEFTPQSLKYFELTDDRDLLASNGQVLFDELYLDLPIKSWTSLLSLSSIKKSILQHSILAPVAPMMLVLSALRTSTISKSVPNLELKLLD
jgi:hypothetical protein